MLFLLNFSEYTISFCPKLIIVYLQFHRKTTCLRYMNAYFVFVLLSNSNLKKFRYKSKTLRFYLHKPVFIKPVQFASQQNCIEAVFCNRLCF